MQKQANLNRQIVKSISWMAVFTYTTQGLSWIVTILVARLLTPQDYGLMGLATIFTEYAAMLADFGLSSAIIQKKEIDRKTISSVFWFTLATGVGLAISCMPLSYLTATVMHEPKVIPLVQIIGIMFIFSTLRIVPSSLLRRELNFKTTSICEAIGTVVSLVVVLVAAKMGAGVWALIVSQMSKTLVVTGAYFIAAKWVPIVSFSFTQVRPFLSFGIFMTVERSIFYLNARSPVFFAGRAWDTATLGMFSLAAELARLPIDKILPLINVVCFSAFSRLQDNKAEIRALYLRAIKMYSFALFPLGVGGFCLGDLLISVLLGHKWEPISPVFKVICISSVPYGFNILNAFMHPALGYPKRGIIYQAITAAVIPLSFALVVHYGFNAIIIPYMISGFVIAVGWIIYSLYLIGISKIAYTQAILSSAVASAAMGLAVVWMLRILAGSLHPPVLLALTLICGAVVYAGIVWVFDRELIRKLIELARGKAETL